MKCEKCSQSDALSWKWSDEPEGIDHVNYSHVCWECRSEWFSTNISQIVLNSITDDNLQWKMFQMWLKGELE